MEPDRWKRIQDLFLRAAELPDEERAAFLEASCPDDAELRDRVAAMLPHDEDHTDLMAAPIASEAEAMLGMESGLAPGDDVGPYRLDRELGMGGMGTVHLAFRADDQYRKQVAVKVMRAGAAGEDLLRRFRSERQILASLDHPNIARLLDGGATAAGAPYVVMEYVEGERIDAYCDRLWLSIDDRLRLFRDVCAAVHYAHQNLIVHRDLKPANILVTEAGTPKLLDFGIAKLLHPEAFEESVAVTSTEMRLLTPEYASPEQVRGEPITTASDVYSLGVLLHQLLSGRLPYRLRTRTAGEMERIICEQEPTRPSAFASDDGSAEDAPSPEAVAAARGTESDRLRRRLAGDLDVITLRALQKEPARRYPSVEQLSEDIRRHVEGLPIVARKDTWRYRSTKFMRRNPWGAAAAALILLLIAGSSVGFFLQAQRIAGERDRALAAEAAARTEAATAGQVTDFLVELFEFSDPAEARGREVPVREVLERGARRVRSELEGEPEVQARLMLAISSVYHSLNIYDDAISLAEEALRLRREQHGEEHEETARALAELGSLYTSTGDHDAAEEHLLAALEIRRRLLGPEHDDIAGGLDRLGLLRDRQGRLKESEALHREALAMGRDLHDEGDIVIANSLNHLGWSLHRQGRDEEAEEAQLEALAIKRDLLGEDHPSVAITLNNLAQTLRTQGHIDEAVERSRQALALLGELNGEDSFAYGVALNNLASALKESGDLPEAEELQRRSLEIARQLVGDDHPFTFQAVNNLANILHDQGKLDGAEELHRRNLTAQTRKFGRRHGHTASTLANLANLLWDKGDHDDAEPLMREVLEIDREAFGAEHPWVALDMNNLAVVLRDRGHPADRAESEEMFVQSVDAARAALGDVHPSLGVYVGEYGIFLVRTGRLDEGEQRVREALAIFEEVHGSDHFQIDMARAMLGECLAARGLFEEAEQLTVSGYEALRSRVGDGAGATRRALQRVVALYEAWGRPDLADSYRSRFPF